MAEQIILEFVGDPSGLKPLADAYAALGQLTDEQIADFKKANESYIKLQTTAKKTTDETTKSIDKQAQKLKEIPKAIAGKEITEAAKGMANVGKEVDGLVKKSVSLKTELRRVKEELAKIDDEGSVEFQSLAIRAARLEDKIGDVNERVRVLASDTFKFDAAVDAIRGVTAAFTIAQGAAALFGDENEDVQKALLKVQAATGILIGVQEIANQVTGQGAAKLFILNAAQKVNAFVTGLATRAVTFFGAASASAWAVATLGLSVLITAIVYLLTNLEDVNRVVTKIAQSVGLMSESQDNAAESLRKYNLFLYQSIKLEEERIRVNNKYLENAEKEIALAKIRGDSEIKILELELEVAKNRVEIFEEGLKKRRIALTEDNRQAFAALKNNVDIIEAQITQTKKEEVKKRLQFEKDYAQAVKEINEDLHAKLQASVLDAISKDLDDERKKKEIQEKANKFFKEIFTEEEPIQAEIELELKLSKEEKFRKELKETIQETITEISQATSDTIFQIGSERRQRDFDEEILLMNKARENELSNKELTESQKAAIDKKYKKQEAQLKLQAWQAEKNAALGQAAINGLLAITTAIAKLGPPPSPAGIAGIASAAILTALSIAAIAARKPPAFAKGTKNAPEGMALVGEQGPEFVHLKGGSKVITAPETKKILDKYQVPSIVKYDDIMKDSSGRNIIGVDPDAIGKAVAREMAKNKAVNINIDENGFQKFLINGRNKREIVNSRFRI